MILLLRNTGIRRGELLGLHLEDISWHKYRINIVRRYNPNDAWAKGCEREIPILHNRAVVMSAIEHYLNHEYPSIAEDLNHNMLFVNLDSKYRGHPMKASRINKIFEGLKVKTGIKAYPHLFRHTFATHMLKAGYKDFYVQQLLGHRSIITTKDIYSHVIDAIDLHDLVVTNQGQDGIPKPLT